MKLLIGIVVGMLAAGCSKKSEAPAGTGSMGSNGSAAVEVKDAGGDAAAVMAVDAGAVASDAAGAAGAGAVAIDAGANGAATPQGTPPTPATTPRSSGNEKLDELRASVTAVETAFSKATATAAGAKTTKAACAGLAELGGALAELGDVGPYGAEHEWQEAKQDAVDKLGQVLVLCNESGRKPAEIVDGLDGIKGELAALRGTVGGK